MASATHVVDADPSGMAWFMIEDSDGKRRKYVRIGDAPSGATPVLRIHVGPKSEFLQDTQGKALLRQAGPGLPKTIVVEIESSTPGPPAMLGILATWQGWHAYIYESP